MAYATVSWPLLTANDNSGSIAHITCSEENGSKFPIGTTKVECEAYDPSGNNDTCSFLVYIQGMLSLIFW